MYKVGKYNYKSKSSYHSLLLLVIFIFAILLVLLYFSKENTNIYVYYATFFVGISMIIHLILRYFHSIKKIKYYFNEY